MKRILQTITFSLFILITMSFSFRTERVSEIKYKSIKLEFSENSGQNEWGSWQTTNCYKGIDFRVKNKGKSYSGKQIWAVQFRNRYYEKIYFSYEVYDSRPSNPHTTNRTDLDPNETSDGSRDFYLDGSSIYVYVDKVRFNKDGVQEYYNCDK